MKKKSLIREINFVKNNINNYKFKAVFLILIINSFYGIFNVSDNKSFFEGMLNIYSSPWVIAILSLCIFINTINIYDIYKNNYSLINRYKNKIVFKKEMSKVLILANTLILLISIMLNSILFFFKSPGLFDFNLYISGINIIIYFFYHFIRVSIIINLLSLFIYYSLYIFNSITSLIFSILISISIILYPYNSIIITKFKLFFGYYISYFNFENITLDINFSIIQYLILIIIDLILFKISNNIKKDWDV